MSVAHLGGRVRGRCQNCGKPFRGFRRGVKFCSVRCANRACYRKHRIERARWQREYREQNPALMLERRRQSHYRLRLAAFEKIGGARCIRCGETDVRVLQVNHKNGGGAVEFRASSPSQLYRAIRDGSRSAEDLEVRCSNCNIIYEYEIGHRHLPDSV